MVNKSTDLEIKEAFEKLDAMYEDEAPAVPVLAAMLEQRKIIYKRELKRDLSIFLAISFVLAMLLVSLLWKAPAVYLAVQAIGFLAVFVHVHRERKIRRREGQAL